MANSIKVNILSEETYVIPVIDITGFDSIKDMEDDFNNALETIRNNDY